MILGLGPLEIVIILVIVLLIFGPKNLPKLGKSLGKTVKNVREGMESDADDNADAAEAKSDDAAEDVVAVVDDDDADIDEAVVFCNKCGTKNPADSGFCSKCGAELGK
jgi:sec-independent protein translocase protein TatA